MNYRYYKSQISPLLYRVDAEGDVSARMLDMPDIWNVCGMPANILESSGCFDSLNQNEADELIAKMPNIPGWALAAAQEIVTLGTDAEPSTIARMIMEYYRP